MSLTDFWLANRSEVENKHIQQLIGFTGDGQLRDGNQTSSEFREFLRSITSIFLIKFAEQCLTDSFKDSGLVLQDIVNQMGRRLDFKVEDGRYRGNSRDIGYDGLWTSDGHTIIVEVKTTDAFRLSLQPVVDYRQRLVASQRISEHKSSILLVVGREDTGDLEAQIRGSRYAWDIRLISVEALSRLMLLKESVDDPQLVRRIHDILIPHEYTKLDQIVDVLFSTAEDVKQDNVNVEEDQTTEANIKPVSFYEECIERIEQFLGRSLIKRSRVAYSTADEQFSLICVISKEYDKRDRKRYWFAFHPHQKEWLENLSNSFIVFGCGSSNKILIIPIDDFLKYLDQTWTTERNGRIYWHVVIEHIDNRIILSRKKGRENIDITSYLLN